MLFLSYRSLDETDTLIFIDEIQEVPEALNMLRYFYEKYSQYSVIAAGSLLESLFDTKVSFPVGRVEYKVVHPFSFREFLTAMNERMKPVEVKSGAIGRLRSLHLFKYTIVTPRGKAYTLISLPYYLTGKIGDYLK